MHLSINQILQVSSKVEYELDKAMVCAQFGNFHVPVSNQTFKVQMLALC